MEHFETELKILQDNLEPKEDNNLVIEDYIPTIREIIKIFSSQGHSGGSAPFYYGNLSQVIKNTLAFKPLSPITGEDSEWIEHDHGVYQNNRCSAVFKNTKNSKPHYLNAITWQGEDDYDTFSGSVEDVRSRQYIKLPFTPKTFYIDVRREEYSKEKHGDEDYFETSDGKAKYVYRIKDKKQLDEVKEYYDFGRVSD